MAEQNEIKVWQGRRDYKEGDELLINGEVYISKKDHKAWNHPTLANWEKKKEEK